MQNPVQNTDCSSYTRMRTFAYILMAVGILNFIAFFIIALSLGGDAVNGKEEAGRYYLANHGRYTEVSRSVFMYSKVHTCSVWVTHPLVLIGGFILFYDDKKRKTKAVA